MVQEEVLDEKEMELDQDNDDMSHSSEKTLPRGSPSKQAPGGLDTGNAP